MNTQDGSGNLVEISLIFPFPPAKHLTVSSSFSWYKSVLLGSADALKIEETTAVCFPSCKEAKLGCSRHQESHHNCSFSKVSPMPSTGSANTTKKYSQQTQDTLHCGSFLFRCPGMLIICTSSLNPQQGYKLMQRG